ncbi:SDR family oxidoreductase [Nakamurella flavida]|uniref:SDR family oxidoreductase n=1 Tax=Nakamurella flavida TaxID=363630 RepID=A0A938YP19_9ACTN|nr:SDR family oxidoreductase [Nakamurella flavida]MBM9476365.1 SDR family oxidoreductase [Nakamurella flavida]MDP9779535.1 uncharacterized protein YbjT (DUF2867 family) [Nakamurella flavida]
MNVVIAGGHGKIALALSRLLAERGDRVIGLVRGHDHDDDLLAVGANPERFDLENDTADDLVGTLRGADAVVFAAGAGPDSGAARKDTVDRGGAVLLADAAQAAGVRRYLMVSAAGADGPADPGWGEVFTAYMAAKRAADDDLRARDLDWTVLRPGRLTDGAGTGRVALSAEPAPGEVPREDVAAVLLALLDRPETAGHTLELIGGDIAVEQAVAAVG